jgi:hypothetical protein
MNPEDSNLRGAPRFVPTLTEVVDTSSGPQPPEPDALAPAPAAAQSPGLASVPPSALPAAPAAAPNPQALATLMLQQLDLDQQISETIARVLHEQMLGFNGRVQKAVAEVVREAVTKALAQGIAGADDGKNP